EACWMEPFAFQAEDGIRSFHVTGVQACALPIYARMPDVSACGQWVGIHKRSSSGSPPAWTGADRMYVLSVISTKGGVGKTTITANLGALLADAGLRVLLIDLDSQPTLSSYFSLLNRAPCGTFELIAQHQLDHRQVVSHTDVAGLDLVRSNDPTSQLATLLLHAPDGRVRLRNLLPRLASTYDLVLIDTQGSRSVVLEMAVLAADRALSPVLPEMLAAREVHGGTLQLLADLQPLQRMGIRTPPLALLLN